MGVDGYHHTHRSRSERATHNNPAQLFFWLGRPVPALAGTGDVHRLAIFRDCSPRHGDAVLAEFGHELVVAEGMALVLAVHDFLKLQANRVPGDLFPVGADRAAAEETFQRENPARGLNPLVVDRAG